MAGVAFAPLLREGDQNAIDLLCLGAQEQPLAHLAQAGHDALALKLVQLHVGTQGPLAHDALLAHPGGGPVLLDEVLVSLEDLLGLLPVVLGRVAHDNLGLVNRLGRQVDGLARPHALGTGLGAVDPHARHVVLECGLAAGLVGKPECVFVPSRRRPSRVLPGRQPRLPVEVGDALGFRHDRGRRPCPAVRRRARLEALVAGLGLRHLALPHRAAVAVAVVLEEGLGRGLDRKVGGLPARRGCRAGPRGFGIDLADDGVRARFIVGREASDAAAAGFGRAAEGFALVAVVAFDRG